MINKGVDTFHNKSQQWQEFSFSYYIIHNRKLYKVTRRTTGGTIQIDAKFSPIFLIRCGLLLFPASIIWGCYWYRDHYHCTVLTYIFVAVIKCNRPIGHHHERNVISSVINNIKTHSHFPKLSLSLTSYEVWP